MASDPDQQNSPQPVPVQQISAQPNLGQIIPTQPQNPGQQAPPAEDLAPDFDDPFADEDHHFDEENPDFGDYGDDPSGNKITATEAQIRTFEAQNPAGVPADNQAMNNEQQPAE